MKNTSKRYSPEVQERAVRLVFDHQELNPNKINPDDIYREQQRPKFDAALALATAEQKDRKLAVRMDTQMQVAMHEHGPLHVHVETAVVQGPYNLSLYVEGDYCPEHGKAMSPGGHSHMSSRRQVEDACGPDCVREPFFRLLSRQVMVAAKQSALGQARTKAARKKAKRR